MESSDWVCFLLRYYLVLLMRFTVRHHIQSYNRDFLGCPGRPLLYFAVSNKCSLLKAGLRERPQMKIMSHVLGYLKIASAQPQSEWDMNGKPILPTLTATDLSYSRLLFCNLVKIPYGGIIIRYFVEIIYLGFHD